MVHWVTSFLTVPIPWILEKRSRWCWSGISIPTLCHSINGFPPLHPRVWDLCDTSSTWTMQWPQTRTRDTELCSSWDQASRCPADTRAKYQLWRMKKSAAATWSSTFLPGLLNVHPKLMMVVCNFPQIHLSCPSYNLVNPSSTSESFPENLISNICRSLTIESRRSSYSAVNISCTGTVHKLDYLWSWQSLRKKNICIFPVVQYNLSY